MRNGGLRNEPEADAFNPSCILVFCDLEDCADAGT